MARTYRKVPLNSKDWTFNSMMDLIPPRNMTDDWNRQRIVERFQAKQRGDRDYSWRPCTGAIKTDSHRISRSCERQQLYRALHADDWDEIDYDESEEKRRTKSLNWHSF